MDNIIVSLDLVQSGPGICIQHFHAGWESVRGQPVVLRQQVQFICPQGCRKLCESRGDLSWILSQRSEYFRYNSCYV